MSVKLESHAWLDNSSASHYLTPYNSYLQNAKCNLGSNKVYVGSAQTLTIKAIGLVYFHYMYAPHKFLLLSYVLHVPTITRNLLSISKFSMDNNVIFEFLTEKCCVKSRILRKLSLMAILMTMVYTSFPSYHGSCQGQSA